MDLHRIDRSAHTAHHGGATGLFGNRAGSLSGEGVRRVKDPASLLENAREEMGMHLASKIENKTLAERKLGSGGSGVMRMRLEQIDAFLKASRRFEDPKERAAVVRQLLTQPRPQQSLRGQGMHPAMQHSLLQLALEEARNGQLPEAVQQRLEEALLDLDERQGAQVRAGFNTTEAAAGFKQDAAGFERFQNTYTDLVLGQPTLAQTLTTLLQRLAGVQGEDFKQGLSALLKALGADLSATRPSVEPQRLQALVQDVYQLEVAGTVLDGCGQLSRTLVKRFPECSVEALALMQELVALTGERWVSLERFRSLAKQFHAQQLLARIALLSGSRQLLRRMPVKVFPDEEARQSLLGTAQSAVDEAVAEEEERQGA